MMGSVTTRKMSASSFMRDLIVGGLAERVTHPLLALRGLRSAANNPQQSAPADANDKGDAERAPNPEGRHQIVHHQKTDPQSVQRNLRVREHARRDDAADARMQYYHRARHHDRKHREH